MDKLADLKFDSNDQLNTKAYVEHLMNYLFDNDNSSNVICLNSSWGTGKTRFIQMCINMKKDEER